VLFLYAIKAFGHEVRLLTRILIQAWDLFLS